MSYDQFGEPESVEDEAGGAVEAPMHDRRCRKGWIDRDSIPAVPCLICKPHLAPEERRRAMGLGGKK